MSAGTLEIRRHPVLAFILQQPLGAAGLAVIVLMLLAAAFAKWVAPYDPLAVDYGGILAPPSWKLNTSLFGPQSWAFHGHCPGAGCTPST